MRLMKLALVGSTALSLALGSPAYAANDSVTARNASGTTITFCSTDVGGGVMASCSQPINTAGTKVNPATSDSQTAVQETINSILANKTYIHDGNDGTAISFLDYRPVATNLTVVDSGTSTSGGLITGTPTASSFQTTALNAYGTVAIQITGTFVATAQIEGSVDGGTTYVAIQALRRGGSTPTSTLTAPDIVLVDGAGLTNIRVRLTAYSSGTVAVKTAASGAPSNSGKQVQTQARNYRASVSCVQLTLPASGTTYAVNDLIANSATAGSVVPISCVVGSYSGATVRITRAGLLASTTTTASASFSVELYTSSPTVANGDDGAFSSTASGHFCSIPITFNTPAFSNGADGQTSADCVRSLSGTQTIYALLKAVGPYARGSGETLDLTLEVEE